MVNKGWTMKKNKIARSPDYESDHGWSWIANYWDILARNPCILEGVIITTTELGGVIETQEELEGLVGL